MSKVLAFLRALPVALWLYGGGAALVLGVGAYVVHLERQIGRDEEAAKHWAVQHYTDSLYHDSLSAVASGARAEATKAAQAAKVEAAKDRAVQAKVDSTIKEAHADRDNARLALADSLSSASVLRAELDRMVRSSVRDSAVFQQERAQHQRTLYGFDSLGVHHPGLLDALASKDNALTKSVDAENAAVKRAVDAEGQVAVMKRLTPSTVGGWLKLAVAAGGGYAIAKATR